MMHTAVNRLVTVRRVTSKTYSAFKTVRSARSRLPANARLHGQHEGDADSRVRSCHLVIQVVAELIGDPLM